MPAESKSWLQEGIREYEASNYSEAINYFNRQIRYDVRDKDAWYHKGKAWFHREKYDEAQSCFEKVIEIDETFVKAWKWLGNTHIKESQYAQAMNAYDDAINKLGDIPTIWLEKSKLMIQQGIIQEAKNSVEHVLDLDPTLGEAWLVKGQLLDKTGILEEAIKCYTKATRLDKKLSRAWLFKGNALMELGRYKEAIRCYDWTTKLEPNSVDAWYKKGDGLFIMGKTKRARDAFEKVLEIEPEHTDAIYKVGQIYEEMGEIKTALQYYSLTDKEEGRGKTLTTKADAYFRMDELDEALRAYEAALDANPYNFVAWLGRAKVEVINGDYYIAIQSLNQAIKFKSEDPEPYHLKAKALFYLHKYGESLNTFEQSLRLSERAEGEKRIPILLDKATSMMALGRVDEAMSTLREILSENRESKRAEDILNIMGGGSKYVIDDHNQRGLYKDAMRSLEEYKINMMLAESMKMNLPAFQEAYYHAVNEMKEMNFLTVIGIIKSNIKKMEEEFTERITTYLDNTRQIIRNLDVAVDSSGVIKILEKASTALRKRKFKEAFDYIEIMLNEVNELENRSKRIIVLRQQDPRYLDEVNELELEIDSMMEKAERSGLDTSHIKEIITRAHAARFKKNYVETANILKDAKKYVRSLLITLNLDSSIDELKSDAVRAIKKVEETLQSMKIFDFDYPEAEIRIREAKSKLERGVHTEAYIAAKKALNLIPQTKEFQEFLDLYEEGKNLLRITSKFKNFPTKMIADKIKEAKELMKSRKMDQAVFVLRENIPQLSTAIKNRALVVKLKVATQKMARLKKLGRDTWDIQELLDRSKVPMKKKEYEKALGYVDRALRLANDRLP